MKRICLVIVSIISFTSLAKANIDSLGIGEYKGKPVILHKVESKETYYSIARKYGVSPTELIEFNDNNPVRIGDTLKVNKKNLTAKKLTPGAKTIEHSVASGETLFSIARKYGVSVESIKQQNNLSESGIKIGEKLKISAATAKPDEHPVVVKAVEAPQKQTAKVVTSSERPVETPITKNSDTTDANEPVESSIPIRTGREIKELGMGTWISDNDLNQAKSVALHHSAPTGTIIKITNPMSNKSVFVKVVGNFPENSDTKNVLIVISKSAANLLGVRDQKFRIELSYPL
ncbi:septal ring lytic transglycosylase RlpA family protein [Solitalea koreensis]|uniref:LysM domain-containing protein n=1 Tax=Solitalea koreensis TaxID=543615 RepID=A0A521BAJ5_9SPHI|nr:LysM peptidoglycan-binding domain-containing protein [Solitalea koreensis]SMO44116.1 LysM domain-containing protein [Solitalea koreensis]